MRGTTAIGFVFVVGLGACGSIDSNQGVNDFTAGGTSPAANAVADANSAEPASDDAVRAGPCPSRTRNWQVRILPSMNPGEGLEMHVDGEVLPDGEGRRVSFSSYPFSTAPIFEVTGDVDPTQPSSLGGGWGSSNVSQPYDPAFTRVVVRCGDDVLAELPIPRPN